jgi:hypothetical protein
MRTCALRHVQAAEKQRQEHDGSIDASPLLIIHTDTENHSVRAEERHAACRDHRRNVALQSSGKLVFAHTSWYHQCYESASSQC